MTRRFTRRSALAGLGSLTLGAVVAACGDGERPARTAAQTFDEEGTTCTVTAEQAEGPYYFDADAVRSDIREDRKGTTLELAVRVRRAGSCEPVRDAVVDIWHCDAGGVYSGFDAGEGERFLRGTQVTNADGVAEFTTIYPGWYQGRTVHIHAKVHLDRTTVLTTQIYFDDAVTDRVLAGAQYRDAGERDVRNDDDGIYDARTTVQVARRGEAYRGAITFDVREA